MNSIYRTLGYENLPPLLVTSCINPSAPLTNLSNPSQRLALTIEFLGRWLKGFPHIRIVICDGSDFDFDQMVRDAFPNAKIECLHFQNNIEAVSHYGKGYGEGEIVNYAIANSKTLKSVDCFAKITSKLYLKNFYDCLELWNGRFAAFAQFKLMESRDSVTFNMLDTRFYIANKSFYLKYLSDAYLNVRDLDGYYLEHSFKDHLAQNNIASFGLPFAPIFEGVSGSSGKEYSGALDFKALVKIAVEILCAKRTTHFIINNSKKRNNGNLLFCQYVNLRYQTHKIFYGSIKPKFLSLFK